MGQKKYEKTVRELMFDFVEARNLKENEIVSEEEIVKWFNINYPEIKENTITAHISRMTTNDKNRVHFHAKNDGTDDLFYKESNKQFRLYEKNADENPIYYEEKRDSQTIRNQRENLYKEIVKRTVNLKSIKEAYFLRKIKLIARISESDIYLSLEEEKIAELLKFAPETIEENFEGNVVKYNTFKKSFEYIKNAFLNERETNEINKLVSGYLAPVYDIDGNGKLKRLKNSYNVYNEIEFKKQDIDRIFPEIKLEKDYISINELALIIDENRNKVEIKSLVEEKDEVKNIYTKENALSELFIEPEKFDIILNTMKRKKNIILQGSPGVGKTFFAKRLAYTLIGFKDKSKLNMIQFHQSYSYEDFMQGFRPTEEGKFVLKNGVFYEFCQKAIKDSESPYVFIIDEINRGNLSKIFGELMMLIETDKRGEDFSIPLTYSKDENETFFVPENVYIIGTMNTADRSLAIVDYALRRRFSFIDIEPAYNKQSFSDYLEKNGISKELIERINLKLGNLNQIIEKDNRLGKGFRIGHSYFSGNIESENQIEWYKSLIQTEITPLILEYWFDDETQAAGHIEKLMGI